MLTRRDLLIVTAALAFARRDPIGDLRRAVRGPVRRPRDSRGLAFDERWQARRPLAVVEALDSADVRATVRWAARTGTPLAVRSGGHSYSGASTVADGVVLDLRRLNAVSLRGGHAHVGPGAHLIDVYAALARRGVTAPAGSCPSVALGGLALGGGMGLAARDRGLTCDNVVAVELVTADGRLHRCDANTSADLFWACRGGGGVVGVATRFTLRVHPAGRAAWLRCTWPDAERALAAWQAWAPHADPRLTSVLRLGPGETSAIGQFRGSAAALRRLAAPLAASGGAIETGEEDYLALMRRWAGGNPPPHARFAAASAYVSRPLGAGDRAALARLARGGSLLLDAHGGAINRVRNDATAFVHRDALFSVQALTYFDAADTRRALAWVAGARRALARAGNGEAYQNYADPGLKGWRRAYYGANYERLADVKGRFDPDRLFAWPQ